MAKNGCGLKSNLIFNREKLAILVIFVGLLVVNDVMIFNKPYSYISQRYNKVLVFRRLIAKKRSFVLGNFHGIVISLLHGNIILRILLFGIIKFVEYNVSTIN